MNVLTILEQIKETKLKLSQGSVKILQKGFFGSLLSSLGKKALRNLAIPFARDNYNSNAINNFEREITEKSGVRAGKESTDISEILLKSSNCQKIRLH